MLQYEFTARSIQHFPADTLTPDIALHLFPMDRINLLK